MVGKTGRQRKKVALTRDSTHNTCLQSTRLYVHNTAFDPWNSTYHPQRSTFLVVPTRACQHYKHSLSWRPFDPARVPRYGCCTGEHIAFPSPMCAFKAERPHVAACRSYSLHRFQLRTDAPGRPRSLLVRARSTNTDFSVVTHHKPCTGKPESCRFSAKTTASASSLPMQRQRPPGSQVTYESTVWVA